MECYEHYESESHLEIMFNHFLVVQACKHCEGESPV